MASNKSSTAYTPQMLEQIIFCLNRKQRKDGTKKYQEEILSSGTFSVLCPISRELIHPAYNFHASLANGVIYILEGVERMALISSALELGSPIVAAMTKSITHTSSEEAGAFFKDMNSYEKLMGFARAALTELSKSTPRIDSNLQPKLFCGDRNFAHFLWNELPTLDSCIFDQQNIEIGIIYDPFNLCKKHPYSSKLVQIESREMFHGWSANLVFRGTSILVPDKVRLRLLQTIINERKPKKHRIYISIRPNYLRRSLVNQVDFIRSLIGAFREKHGDMEFVLDGFSMPDDMNRSPYPDTLRNFFFNRVESSNSAIRDIVQAIPGIDKNAINITGMNLTDALETISTCSYYICHAGTQQHKIAWLFPRNGFVHSNRTRISDFYVKYDNSGTECSITPSTPDPQFIEDVGVNPSVNDEEEKIYDKGNRKYLIKDLNSVINQIIDDYSNKL